MPRSLPARAALVLILLALGYGGYRFFVRDTPVEARVRAVLAGRIDAVERKHASDFMNGIASDFEGMGLTHATLKGQISGLFLRWRKDTVRISVTKEHISIAANEKSARIELELDATRRRGKAKTWTQMLPGQRAMKFTLELAPDAGGDWKIRKATRHQVKQP